MTSTANLQLVNALASTITTGIEAEVNELRDQANNRIGAREVARNFINTHLQDMPVIVTGDHVVSYIDDRGERQTKTQEKNLSLWCVALQTAIETGHTSYALLGSIFSQWALETLQIDWNKDSSEAAAKKYINAMQTLEMLSDTVEKLAYVDEDGVERESVVVKLSERFKGMMDDEVAVMRDSTHMVCRPLNHQPQDWMNNNDGVGTLSGLQLVKGKLFRGSKVAQPVLDAVNKLQAVRFVVSPAMIDAAYDILDNQHEAKPTAEELRMYQEITQYENKEVFFPVTMDTRGRMYYRGGLLTPQGTDFCKAAFQFAEYLPLGESGVDAIYVHTANMLGHDKLSIDERIGCIESYIDSGTFDEIQDHNDVADKFKGADVFQATVAILEIKRLLGELDEADSIGQITSNLVCHQDGTCNGLQHMAAITHNRQTAITVNCVEASNSDTPSDIYGIIADAARTNTTGEVSTLIAKYSRSMAKNPVMITGYGAGEDTIIANTAKYLADKNEDTSLASAIGEAYISAINSNAGAVRALTEALKARVKNAVSNGLTRFEWKTADGFVASTEYRDIECNRVRAGVFNALVRNMQPAPLDEVKTVGAMAPNFIHSIDAAHLRMVINACDHQLVTVHDSIGSHPCNFFETSKNIREQFVKVHEFRALDSLCENMEQRTPKFRGDYNAVEALKSAYIFS